MFSLSDVLNFFCGPMLDRSDKGRLLEVSSGVQFLIVAGLYPLYAMMVVSLPAFSSEIFGSAVGYGFTPTLFAADSISGRLMQRFPVGKSLPLFFLYGGVSRVLMSLFVARLPLVGGLFVVAASGALGMINIVFGTIFQQLPPREMIGRVHTVNLSLMAAASLLGSVLGGVIGQVSEHVFPFFICGCGYLAIAVAMRANRRTPTPCQR